MYAKSRQLKPSSTLTIHGITKIVAFHNVKQRDKTSGSGLFP